VKRKAVIWGIAAAVALAVVVWWIANQRRGDVVAMLDPAQIIVLRTPGGLLEVATLQKAEEFGWSSRYTCPIVDCSALLTPTVSRVRVQAHFVYRVPLAAEWRLVRNGDHYTLTVPEPQLQAPVAFDTSTMQVQTTEKGWLSPPVAPNREAVIRHLGPELANRGTGPAYLRAVRPSAETTIQEFARKWMLEQGHKPALPVRVEFHGVNPN
jgi:hypothetical protein